MLIQLEDFSLLIRLFFANFVRYPWVGVRQLQGASGAGMLDERGVRLGIFVERG